MFLATDASQIMSTEQNANTWLVGSPMLSWNSFLQLTSSKQVSFIRTFLHLHKFCIEDVVIETTDYFNFLGFILTSILSLDGKIDKRIAKATGVMYKLSDILLENCQQSLCTQWIVDNIYHTKCHLECFHLHKLGRISGITCRSKFSIPDTLKQANPCSSLYYIFNVIFDG